jgi:hypothetical protein
MSDFQRQTGHVDGLQHFLDLARKYFGLDAHSGDGNDGPTGHTPSPDDRSDQAKKMISEKVADEQ